MWKEIERIEWNSIVGLGSEGYWGIYTFITTDKNSKTAWAVVEDLIEKLNTHRILHSILQKEYTSRDRRKESFCTGHSYMNLENKDLRAKGHIHMLTSIWNIQFYPTRKDKFVCAVLLHVLAWTLNAM